MYQEEVKSAIILLYLGILAGMDVRKRQISLVLTGVLFLAGIGWQILVEQTSWLEWLLSLLPGAGFLTLSYISREQVGYGDGLLLLVDLRRALRDHGLRRRDAPVPDRGHRRRDHRRRLRKQEEGVAVVFGIDVHLLDAHDSVRARSGIRWAGDFRREHLA